MQFLKVAVSLNIDLMKRFKNFKIMNTLQKFTVWIPTEFGLGCQTIKGKDFTDAFFRLGKKDKLKSGWIEDESGESITFHEILGIEL